MQEKPSASTYEALTFISRWLLENNPNKPRILTQDDFAREEEEDDEAEFAEVSGAESPFHPLLHPPTPLRGLTCCCCSCSAMLRAFV